MVQTANPVANIQVGGWSGGSGLWDLINEGIATPDESSTETFMGIVGGSTNFIVTMENVEDPDVGTGHTIKVRAKKTGSGSPPTITFTLLDSAGVAFGTRTNINVTGTTYSDFTYTLSEASANAITSYSKMRMSVGANGTGFTKSVEVTTIELEVPNIAISNNTIAGTVTDWFRDIVIEGARLVATTANGSANAVSDSNGVYSIEVGASSQSVVVTSEYFDWLGSPCSYNIGQIQVNQTGKDFTIGPDSLWPNAATPFAFRTRLNFDTTRPILHSASTRDVEFKTGLQRIAAPRRGHTNESIQHSAGNSIDHFGGKTHMLFRGVTGSTMGVTIDKDTNDYTIFNVGTTRSIADSHYYPSMLISKDGNIHWMDNGHNDIAPSGSIYYRFPTNNTLSHLSTLVDTAWIGGIANAGEYTYSRMRSDSASNIYIFTRDQAGFNSSFMWEKRHTDGTWDHHIDSTVPTSSSYNKDILRFNKYNALDVSVYSGGVQIDDNDIIHFVGNITQGYLGANISSHLYYMYSPPSLHGTTTEPGHYWYAANGSIVGISTYGTVDPCVHLGVSANAAIVATAFHTAQTYENFNYHTNTEGLQLHPTLRYSSGNDDNRAGLPVPYFTFHSWSSSLSEPCHCYCTWHSAAATESNDYGWVVRRISTAALDPNGDWTRAWKGRNFGNMVITDQGHIRIFGMFKPPGFATSDAAPKFNADSALWGAELSEWNSLDNGENWSWRQITKNSSVGIGMVNVKNSFSNREVELVYGRGNDVIYLSSEEDFAEIQDTGDDFALYYGANEKDRITDFWNLSSSNVTIKLQRQISTTYSFDTAHNYYFYYGKASANSTVLKDPNNIYGHFENWESYTDGDTVRARGAWLVSTVNYPKYATTNFRIINSESSSTLDMYSGDKSLDVTLNDGGTAYAYTVAAVNYQTDIRIDCHIKPKGTLAIGGWLGVTYGDSDTVYAIGTRSALGGTAVAYYSGDNWKLSDYTPAFIPQANGWAKYSILVHSTKGVNFMYEDEFAKFKWLPVDAPGGKINNILLGISHRFPASRRSFFDLFSVKRTTFPDDI